MTTPPGGIVVAHSSDLHLGDDHGGDGDTGPLVAVLDAARAAGADVLVLAGDVFDHNRLGRPFLERAAQTMALAGLPIVILPGNHDFLGADSVYRRGGMADAPTVSVLGITADDTVVLPELDLAVRGRPHLDGADMSPLPVARPRAAGRQIVVAHGHVVSDGHDRHRSWLIRRPSWRRWTPTTSRWATGTCPQ